MITIRSKTLSRRTENFLTALINNEQYRELDRYGRMGVEALSRATPKDSGETANSWSYEIVRGRGKVGITWFNSNVNDGANIAILLQYGHGTGTGGYVEGYDYINPAIQPIFDQIADNVWAKVQTS